MDETALIALQPALLSLQSQHYHTEVSQRIPDISSQITAPESGGGGARAAKYRRASKSIQHGQHSFSCHFYDLEIHPSVFSFKSATHQPGLRSP